MCVFFLALYVISRRKRERETFLVRFIEQSNHNQALHWPISTSTRFSLSLFLITVAFLIFVSVFFVASFASLFFFLSNETVLCLFYEELFTFLGIMMSKRNLLDLKTGNFFMLGFFSAFFYTFLSCRSLINNSSNVNFLNVYCFGGLECLENGFFGGSWWTELGDWREL